MSSNTFADPSQQTFLFYLHPSTAPAMQLENPLKLRRVAAETSSPNGGDRNFDGNNNNRSQRRDSDQNRGPPQRRSAASIASNAERGPIISVGVDSGSAGEGAWTALSLWFLLTLVCVSKIDMQAAAPIISCALFQKFCISPSGCEPMKHEYRTQQAPAPWCCVSGRPEG